MVAMDSRLLLAVLAWVWVIGPLAAQSGEPAPLLPDDLAREAEKASPQIAEILRKLATPSEDYAKQVLAAAGKLLTADDAKEGAWAAEKSLRAGLRYVQSQRAGDTDALAHELATVRGKLLKLLDADSALKWADV